MDLRSRKLGAVKEKGWHIVSTTCWRTSYQSVSWAYDAAENNSGSGFRGSLFSTYRTSCDSPRPCQPGDDLVLSSDLCGVKCALDALVKYERHVGFLPETPISKPRRDISVKVDEHVIARAREKWESYAEALTSGVEEKVPDPILEEQLARVTEVSRTSTPASSHGGLHRSTSTLSSVYLTDSDMSLESSSPPSTPTRKSTEAIIEVKDMSPVKADHGHYVVSAARPLNAGATSFVPSSAASKADTEPFSFVTTATTTTNPSSFVNFTFPTPKASPLPTVQIKKDEQGFYSEAEVAAPVPQSQKENCAFLPPFLQSSSRRKGPASKTRAIVDQLRSSHNHSHSPIPNAPLYDINLDERTSVSEDDRTQNSGLSSPSSHEDEDDGWINIAEADKTSKESKARRTRDLFLALTRRRSDSLPPSQTDTAVKDEHTEIEFPTTTSPSSSSSPLPSQDDGWIDPSPAAPLQAPPQRRAQSRPRSSTRRRRSSHAAPVPVPMPPTLIPSPFIPVPNARAPVGLPHVHASFPVPAIPNYTSPNPPPFFYSAYPTMVSPMAYTSYMQQLQLMQQMQMRGGGGGRRASAPASNEWFQYTTAGVPFTTVNPSTPAAPRELLW
ncbi:hypothetical protein J132_01601 [Termitomyces sp. J132]|nr:hypothetical protein H2248_004438 [Termitomyces sp. 'cryptogamus']KNZ75757.1 hypothetical protein J132_01601 [Termitomyces sp. J132]